MPAILYTMRPAQTQPLRPQCKHHRNGTGIAEDVQKYWAQRYRIFCLYDEGIYMTHDAWFGVTPEPVATRIAEDVADLNPARATVVDLFAGVGGNSIAFALNDHYAKIIAIERDPAVLACAQRNAAVYGVAPDRITWVLGDSFQYLDLLTRTHPSAADPARAAYRPNTTAKRRDSSSSAAVASATSGPLRPRASYVPPALRSRVRPDSSGPLAAATDTDTDTDTTASLLHPSLRVDLDDTVLFASPPWGGPGYADDAVFDLETMEPYGLGQMACDYRMLGLASAIYLPRTGDLRQLARLAPEGGKIEVVQYCIEGASKALVAYIPARGKDGGGV